MVSDPATLRPNENVIGHLLRYAVHSCHRAGHRAHDPEVGSAIGWSLLRALDTHDPSKGDLYSWVARLAVQECVALRRRQAVADRRLARMAEALTAKRQATGGTLDRADLELLRFCAHHGPSRAARLLGMRHYKLQGMLQAIRDKLT